MKTAVTHRIAVFALAGALSACASTTNPGVVDVTRRQLLLIPSETIEQMASTSFHEQVDKAKAAGKLATSGAQYEQLTRIAKRLERQAPAFRGDAASWTWEVALIDAPVLNASAAPGGKITVYTGLITQLKLSDDELAMIIGHEIAHALREHGRERVSRAIAHDAIASVAFSALPTKEAQLQLARQFAGVLFELPNSRQNEIEADQIGLELSARAGYKPEAAISVWQKMAAASHGRSPPEFLSTHPPYENRVARLRQMIPRVQPLYAAAR